MEKATVHPNYKLQGEVLIPSSKPHIQRALLLALLNTKVTKIVNMSWNAETENLLRALQQFGLEVLENDCATLVLRGVGKRLVVKGDVHAEGSGMLFRICSALASLTDEVVRIRCNESLFSRESLFDDAFSACLNISLVRVGSGQVEVRRKIATEKLPLTANSSTQFISFALFIAPYGATKYVPVRDEDAQSGYVGMTIESMELLGCKVEHSPGRLTVSDYVSKDITINIPSDFTSLSYIASSMLSVMGKSEVSISGYHHGETLNEQHLFKLYSSFGLTINHDRHKNVLLLSRYPAMPVHAEISLKELPSAAANIMAAVSNLGGKVIFNGVKGINNHKCQRAFVISENIRNMGGTSSLVFNNVGMFEKIYIGGQGQLKGGAELHSYGDHRVCAANLIASLGAKQETTIHGTGKLNDGFPGFLDVLKSLGADIK